MQLTQRLAFAILTLSTACLANPVPEAGENGKNIDEIHRIHPLTNRVANPISALQERHTCWQAKEGGPCGAGISPGTYGCSANAYDIVSLTPEWHSKGERTVEQSKNLADGGNATDRV